MAPCVWRIVAIIYQSAVAYANRKGVPAGYNRDRCNLWHNRGLTCGRIHTFRKTAMQTGHVSAAF